MRLKLLRLFLFNDDTPRSPLADASFRARGAGKDAARKEIALLVSIDLLKKKNGAKGIAYQANRQFSHYEALMVFLRDTTAIGDKDVLDDVQESRHAEDGRALGIVHGRTRIESGPDHRRRSAG